MNISKLTILALIPFNAFAMGTSIMPPTTYTDTIDGQPVTYSVNGELNYLHGFSRTKSHGYNSWLSGTISTSIANGLDVVGKLKSESEYDPSKDDYEVKPMADVSLSWNAHTLSSGYKNILVDKIFNSTMENSLDVNNTENAIGIMASNRDGFVEYSYAYQDMNFGVGTSFHGDFYLTASKYIVLPETNTWLKDVELSAVAFQDVNDDAGGFVSASSTVFSGLSLSAGLGSVADKFSFNVGGNYVVNEHLALHTNVVGNQDYSTATVGAELAYDIFVAYVDYKADLSENYTNEKDSKLGVGVKVIF